MKNTEKKELAKELYLTGNFTQKQIAAKVDVTEKTMSKWVNEGEWESTRESLLTTSKEQLAFLYNQLSGLRKSINDRDEGKQFADSKEADSILKLTQAIKNLQTETGLGETIEVFTKFMKWLSKEDLAKAQEMEGLMDAFIQEMSN